MYRSPIAEVRVSTNTWGRTVVRLVRNDGTVVTSPVGMRVTFHGATAWHGLLATVALRDGTVVADDVPVVRPSIPVTR